MPIVIYDVNDLQAMQNDLTAYYELANDIDASATVGWNGGKGFIPVGTYVSGHPELAFSGAFDGKGHIISELNIHSVPADYDSFLGLFGYTRYSGEIKSVGIEDCNITGGYEWVGALIGYHNPTHGIITSKVSNCYSTGVIKAGSGCGGLLGYTDSEVEDCWSSCDITAESITINDEVAEVGGLIGQNCPSVAITRCYTTGNIVCNATGTGNVWSVGGLAGLSNWMGMSRCFATGNITISGRLVYQIGGLVGTIDYGVHQNCYARGNITVVASNPANGWLGGLVGINYYTIENCYSAGEVTPTAGQPNIGGLVGGNYQGTVTNCFWDIQTSGQSDSDGGTGKTTAEMKTLSTFSAVGWDITASIWLLIPECNNGYPCLWNITPSCALILPVIYPPYELTALEALRNIEMSAAGRVYVDETGKLRYESRYARNP